MFHGFFKKLLAVLLPPFFIQFPTEKNLLSKLCLSMYLPNLSSTGKMQD